jgi:16S rRNA (guanine527-N7)-methyltransferase
MEQSRPRHLDSYAALIESYRDTLDLMSATALDSLDEYLAEAVRYGELLRSLSPAPASILDLGSGVGLPGVPIAMVLPEARVTLAERRRRRIAFLRIALSRLGLENASVFGEDVRSLREPRFDAVVAQAVGRLLEVYELTRHLHGENVWIVSRKGQEWREELEELEASLGSTALEAREEPLPRHGRLVAVLLPGGHVCRQSG